MLRGEWGEKGAEGNAGQELLQLYNTQNWQRDRESCPHRTMYLLQMSCKCTYFTSRSKSYLLGDRFKKKQDIWGKKGLHTHKVICLTTIPRNQLQPDSEIHWQTANYTVSIGVTIPFQAPTNKRFRSPGELGSISYALARPASPATVTCQFRTQETP